MYFCILAGPRGAVHRPKAMKAKGTKRSDKKKNQQTRVTYKVKRLPKWEGAPSYGASPPTSPVNRTPPPDQLKYYLKTIFSIKGCIQKTRRKKHTHSSHTHPNLSQEKKPQCNQQRRPRGETRRERRTSSKANSEPTKTAVQSTKATEGEQREGRHTNTSKKRKKQREEDHSTANKGDRGRHTRTTLRKTEMKRVTNDLTHTATGVGKKAPAPRPKTFKKQR